MHIYHDIFVFKGRKCEQKNIHKFHYDGSYYFRHTFINLAYVNSPKFVKFLAKLFALARRFLKKTIIFLKY